MDDYKKELSDIAKMLYVMNKVLTEMVILTYPNDKYYLLKLLCDNGIEYIDD